jgi:surfeit locus 1 family protein
MILKRMFSRAWLLTSLFVFAGSALCVRLGIWQLARLQERRAFNAQVESMRAAEPVDLNRNIPADISSMEWRGVKVTGKYDFENQIALRNQYNANLFGYHLITPLLFDGGAVLVDRGWIPADGNSSPKDWHRYDEPGQIIVTGQIRLGQDKPAFGGEADAELALGQLRLDIWNNLNVTRISKQSPYLLLPIYIQPNPDGYTTEPPIKSQPLLDLTEGPHLGYAFQWFSFAAILFSGYIIFIRRQVLKA